MFDKKCFAMLLCGAMLLTGCQSSAKSTPTEPASQVTEATSAESQTGPVSVEFVIERFLAQRPDAIRFDAAPGSEYGNQVAFFFSEDVADFRFWKVVTEPDADGRLICMSQECVYEEPSLTTDQLLVINVEFAEFLPIHAISFVDSRGQELFYYLAASGEDNVPLLLEH